MTPVPIQIGRAGLLVSRTTHGRAVAGASTIIISTFTFGRALIIKAAIREAGAAQAHGGITPFDTMERAEAGSIS